MRKILFFIILFFVFLIKVNASEMDDYSFTEDDLRKIHFIYYDGYENHISYNEYLELQNIDINDIQQNIITDANSFISSYSSSHSTANKEIKLSKSCYSNECTVYLTVNWFSIPTIRSYDLLGIRLVNTSILQNVSSRMIFGNVENTYVETRNDSNGNADTFKLPSGNEIIHFTKTFKVQKNGSVYASYQHAKRNISLINSRRYTFASGGFGNVFSFDSAVGDYYDEMGGVSISLN